ncbi:MAG: WYL domain-containing protein [Bacteroidetes bacterium]|nr:WYL domain-containing protein [Bacteroidota bacterium]
MQEDIVFMVSEDGYGIELDRIPSGKRLTYRYKDPNYSIFNSPLDETEMAKIKEAITILGNFKGLPQFDWMEDLITKLNHGVVNTSTQEAIISFDSNKYLKGIEHLGVIYNAIRYKNVLKLEYLPFEYENPLKLEFHPYYLKQYNNRWFVYGYYSEAKKSDWNIALDRIVTIKESKTKYKLNEAIEWEEYFEDIYGVTQARKG